MTGSEPPPERPAEAAHRYAEHGWPVFPVQPGEKLPLLPSAHPDGGAPCAGECGREGHGFHDATTDHQVISRWWNRAPEANVGIATGSPGPDVVDVDRKPDRSGYPAWNKAKAAGLVDGAAAMVRTPSGGLHAYFAGTDQRSGSCRTQALDFRSAGGYVVAPPSWSGEHGRRYEVLQHQASSATVDWQAVRQLVDPAPGPRRQWVPQAEGSKNLDHLVEYVAGCTDRVNERLFWAACRMVEAGQEHRLPELAEAAYAAGEDRRGQAERTISSALRTAAPRGREPRPFEPEREAG